GSFVTGVVLLMMMGATIGFPTPVGNVQPALQSWWLITHVSVAVVASGIFALTFSMSVLQLFKQRAEKQGPVTGFMRLVPRSEEHPSELRSRLDPVARFLLEN